MLWQILSSKKGLVKNHLPPFHNMRFLELQTRFDRHNVQALSCLFKSCPMLNILLLKIINDQTSERRVSNKENQCFLLPRFLNWICLLMFWQQWNNDLWDMSNSEIQYWESQTYEVESFLKNLEFVEIHGFLECENEMSLAIFLLRHGKALIKMTLRSSFLCRDNLRRQMIRSQLMGFSKASSKAKISFHWKFLFINLSVSGLRLNSYYSFLSVENLYASRTILFRMFIVELDQVTRSLLPLSRDPMPANLYTCVYQSSFVNK